MRGEVSKQISRRVLTAIERQEFVAASHITNSAEETVLCTTCCEGEGGLTELIGYGVRVDAGGALRTTMGWRGFRGWDIDDVGPVGWEFLANHRFFWHYSGEWSSGPERSRCGSAPVTGWS